MGATHSVGEVVHSYVYKAGCITRWIRSSILVDLDFLYS